ncbi:hypothetical protein TNCV_2834141 [Trichonephila clavipes]|nr:hypothetical protein TNCV_2834141 [Trichonephila clavipes]
MTHGQSDEKEKVVAERLARDNLSTTHDDRQPCADNLVANESFPTTEKMKGSCLINSSIVLGLRIIGKGFSAGKKLCTFLGLPFLSKLAFRNQERKLLKATERDAQENINTALSEIKGSNSFNSFHFF